MPQDILSAAREQAEQSDPPVQASALLRIARVLTAFNQVEAERVLERGIELATELPEPDRSTILNGAVSLAAMVSPRRALGLASSPRWPAARKIRTNGRTYLRHAEPPSYCGGRFLFLRTVAWGGLSVSCRGRCNAVRHRRRGTPEDPPRRDRRMACQRRISAPANANPLPEAVLFLVEGPP